MPIGPSHARFRLERLVCCQGRAPLLDDSGHIFGMNRCRPAPALHVLQSETQIFQPTSIEEINVTVRQSGMDQSGSCVDDKPLLDFDRSLIDFRRTNLHENLIQYAFLYLSWSIPLCLTVTLISSIDVGWNIWVSLW